MSVATGAASGAPADTVASKADERRAIGVASGAHALHDGYTDLIYVMLPLWQAEFGIGFAALGLLRTCYSGTMASLQIPSALISERLGIPLVLAVGTALSGIGYLVAGASVETKAAAGGGSRFGCPVLLSSGMTDSATRMGFLIFLPFVLIAKGASRPTVGLALTLVFAGGAAGKLVCAFIGARLGVITAVCLTEGLTTAGIFALLPLPLEAALIVLPIIGIMLNGTSSVLYGSVPELGEPAKRTALF